MNQAIVSRLSLHLSLALALSAVVGCEDEELPPPPVPDAGVVDPGCGNGVIEGSEQCDDANVADGDGCSSLCELEPGWSCLGEPSGCDAVCGDGMLSGREVCDDGNEASGDGCSAGCNTIEEYYVCPTAGEPCETVPFDELLRVDFDRYIGAAPPPEVVSDGRIRQYEWANDAGPICMDGSSYRMAEREGPSDALLIFLQGGGFCYSGLCLATQSADSELNETYILDHTREDNPFRDFDVAFLPYCDGSLFGGDTNTQRGLRNLSAALDVIRERFPNPSRIVLVGASAGGYGTIPATALTRIVYPEPEILSINDSGVGLGREGDPGFLQGIAEELDFAKYIEAACTDRTPGCADNEHVTWLVDYAFDEDPNLRYGAISSYNDLVIGTVFLQQPLKFKRVLQEQMRDFARRHPGRFAYFAFNGISHTSTQDVVVPFIDPIVSPIIDLFAANFYTKRAGGVWLSDWLWDAVYNPDDWESTAD